MKKTVILTVILLSCILLSCCIGRYYLSIIDIFRIISGNATDAMQMNVFLKIRLPRTILVTLSGYALALSGFVYQGLFKNPLVSPDVLGVSSGCSVGAVCGILFAGGSQIIVQSASFISGIIIVMLSILLSKLMGGQKTFSMILSGIILGSLSNSILMTLKYIADPAKHLAAIEYWLMGSFNNASWNHIKIVLPMILISSFIIFLLAKQLMVLSISDEDAQSLGINVPLVRFLSIFCATVLVSCVVSVAGVVSWIGLIVPHMVRIFAGHDYVKNIYQSSLLGASLLLVADILSRSAFSAEIPISIFTSLISAGFLMIFLYIKNREA